MSCKFKRSMSYFWIHIQEDDNGYSISTNKRYIKIMNHFFPVFERKSPTKWSYKL